MAEVVVVAGHQMHGVIAADEDIPDKIVPGGGHHLVVEGHHQHLVDAVEAADQPPAVLRRVDERTGLAVMTSLGGRSKVNTAGSHPGRQPSSAVRRSGRRGPDGLRRRSPGQ